MNRRITVLPEEVASKIAAGEVVERPSSIVKELLENALDAGATDITIELRGGGKELIRIVDNGAGIAPGDVPLAFERHATSKILTVDDLYDVKSFGFRGEALPSIAAVCRVEMSTRRRGDVAGTRIAVENGRILENEAVGCPEGTSIAVSRIFDSLPVRKKFLRQDATEQGHCLDIIVRVLLPHGAVRAKVLTASKTLLEIPRTENLYERIVLLLGSDLRNHLVSAGGEKSRDEPFGICIQARFHPLLDEKHVLLHQRQVCPGCPSLPGGHGRLPQPPRGAQIPRLRPVHRTAPRDDRCQRPPGEARGPLPPPAGCPGAAPAKPLGGPLGGAAGVTGDSGGCGSPGAHRRLRGPEALQPFGGYCRPPAHDHGARALEDVPDFSPGQDGLFPSMAGGREQVSFASLDYLGQIEGTYLVFSAPGVMILLDQHAAHERILYERLKQSTGGNLEVQSLLIPEILEMNPRDFHLLIASRDMLQEAGMEVEAFGENTAVVKSVPALLGQADVKALVREILDGIADSGLPRDEKRNRILIGMACRGAIKANQALTADEVRHLCRDLDSIPFASNCPHGRPVFIELPAVVIERMFKRT